MNKLVWVKINSGNYFKVMARLNNIGISLYDNKKYKDYILIETTYEDLEKIQKYLISYKIELYAETGFKKVQSLIKKYLIFTIASIISILILFIANNTIFKIDVKSNNKVIRDLVKENLNKYNLKPLRQKISHKKIETIVKKILDNNKDVLEWLEIEYDGLIMNVYVTEKVIPKEEEQNNFCNIVAKSDAKITNINLYRGVLIKEVNDYVIKGDIIISGEVTYNEEVKNNVCASGEVYGEVWYKVKVTVPFKEDYIEYTGKNRYNFNVRINDNKYRILKSRIKKKKEEETNLYKLNDFEINLVKEREYVNKTRIISEEEAYEKALLLAEEKVKLKLKEKEDILVKKVLKKEVNNSTIYLEVFIATKENIGVEEIAKENDISDNGDNS